MLCEGFESPRSRRAIQQELFREFLGDHQSSR